MVERTPLSATEAARRFSDRLDDVEREGRVFVITRRGRPVALLSPAPALPPTRRTWAEAVRGLRAGPRADEGFAEDMDAIRRSAGPLPPDPWARS